MRTSITSTFVALATLVAVQTARADALPAEPNGFRMSDYNSEVPAGVADARVITSAAELGSLIAETSPALFDVYPAPNRSAQLPKDVLWIEPSRETLPNAVWLANVGMGPVPTQLEALLAATLASATGGDKSFPVVFFCEPRCWHSWNATKRAVLLGYENVHWYKGGVEGWRLAGFPLETVRPVRPE
jgi:PQQ-dependent catabolism-associated CXXCW motif protein